MRFTIDVAHLHADGTVLRITQMPPQRIGCPVRGAYTVIEAQSGSFERWGLQVGDLVELRTDDN
jgi:uncharacterized protein